MSKSITEKMYRNLDSLLYPANKPIFATMLTNSVNLDSLSKADTEAKLMTLGALLATGKHNVLSEASKIININEIEVGERALLVNQLFALFYEHLWPETDTSSCLVESLMQVLIIICPESILAHKATRELPVRQSLIRLNYDLKINTSVSGVVFFREFMYGPGTRRHEFGYRIKTALASQGWEVSLLASEEMQQYSSSSIHDFALIDFGAFSPTTPVDSIYGIISYLKQFFRKIIAIDPDPWVGTYNGMLSSLAGCIDYIWGFTSDWIMAKEPLFKDRCIMFPNVGGFDHLDKNKRTPLDWSSCTFNFTGSVQGYNLNRIYWILESISRKLPIKINVTNPALDDGLDHESSLQLYAQSLASTHASLNFATRRDGSRILTGRAIEVISMNRLLIQEKCPALHDYYIEGEHFLDFIDIEELSTIIDFLKSHPKVGQTICDQGYQFYQSNYSSQKLVEHIQTFL